MGKLQLNSVRNGNVVIEMLETGAIRGIFCDGIMINQMLGNCVEGMQSNIYLRIKDGEGHGVYPLTGYSSNCRFAFSDSQVVFAGTAGGVGYTLYLTPAGNMWFYDVVLKSESGTLRADIIYAQDIGLAGMGHVLSNEAYNSQYIDHKAFETERGYVVCSRQNQRQHTGNPFLQQGCLQKAVSFSVDGYPFFGLSYKFDNKIAELSAEKLNDRIYQYEFAYTSLQSAEFDINAESETRLTFYGAFRGDIGKVEKPLCIEEIESCHNNIKLTAVNEWQSFTIDLDVNNTLCSLPLSTGELDSLYPKEARRHEECDSDGHVLSFFTETGEHIVLMEKERYVERSHGHIIISGKNDYIAKDVLASTSYIYGIFNSQIVVGNTSFNKLITNARNGLNVSKVSGQRIMLKTDGEYKLLTMPAVYELGFNYAKWIYKLDNDILEITVFTRLDCASLNFSVKSQNNETYDILLMSQVCGAPSEYDSGAEITRIGNTLEIKHGDSPMSKNAYPDLAFVMEVDCGFNLLDDSVFYKNTESLGEPMMVMEFTGVSGFVYELEGRIDGKPVNANKISFDAEKNLYRNWLKEGIGNFRLSLKNAQNTGLSEVERFNDISLWYSHNARIHYASPHGLEQYGGAAWGTRDVCQGPFEYFMAAQSFGVAKDILKKVYSHQFAGKKSWPQWFMFDNYRGIQSYDSQGDVIVWPIKALASYILSTGDTDFLNTELPYTNDKGFNLTEHTEPLYGHVKKAVDSIIENFIDGTSLSCYGDGDWDDTLQPANAELRKKMVSGWTVALTHQAFKEFADAIKDFDKEYADELETLAGKIKADFHKYIISDGITAGFLVFGDDSVKYLLHPKDDETGLNYRLLPMTRSIIGEIFTKEEAEKHIALINRHLKHPDGVRLMDTTCKYNGGVNTYFMRAETAANFGREIGLQYVHAHIRYIEAMAKMGYYNEVWQGLLQINPILIDTVVSNAEKRQSNCYFSSSDGKFDNRYEAMSGFDGLRDGSVNVKAGWRIYSSGSGIYLNRLITQCLGLRTFGGNVVFDPVLPPALDGLVYQYTIFDMPVSINYHISSGCGVSKLLIDGVPVDFRRESNPYREGGAIVGVSNIKPHCVIDVFV